MVLTGVSFMTQALLPVAPSAEVPAEVLFQTKSGELVIRTTGFGRFWSWLRGDTRISDVAELTDTQAKKILTSTQWSQETVRVFSDRLLHSKTELSSKLGSLTTRIQTVLLQLKKENEPMPDTLKNTASCLVILQEAMGLVVQEYHEVVTKPFHEQRKVLPEIQRKASQLLVEAGPIFFKELEERPEGEFNKIVRSLMKVSIPIPSSSTFPEALSSEMTRLWNRYPKNEDERTEELKSRVERDLNAVLASFGEWRSHARPGFSEDEFLKAQTIQAKAEERKFEMVENLKERVPEAIRSKVDYHIFQLVEGLQEKTRNYQLRVRAWKEVQYELERVLSTLCAFPHTQQKVVKLLSLQQGLGTAQSDTILEDVKQLYKRLKNVPRPKKKGFNRSLYEAKKSVAKLKEAYGLFFQAQENLEKAQTVISTSDRQLRELIATNNRKTSDFHLETWLDNFYSLIEEEAQARRNILSIIQERDRSIANTLGRRQKMVLPLNGETLTFRSTQQDPQASDHIHFRKTVKEAIETKFRDLIKKRHSSDGAKLTELLAQASDMSEEIAEQALLGLCVDGYPDFESNPQERYQRLAGLLDQPLFFVNLFSDEMPVTIRETEDGFFLENLHWYRHPNRIDKGNEIQNQAFVKGYQTYIRLNEKSVMEVQGSHFWRRLC